MGNTYSEFVFAEIEAAWDKDGDLKIMSLGGDLIGYIYSSEVDILLNHRPNSGG